MVRIGLGAAPKFCFDILGLDPGVELELAYADCCTEVVLSLNSRSWKAHISSSSYEADDRRLQSRQSLSF